MQNRFSYSLLLIACALLSAGCATEFVEPIDIRSDLIYTRNVQFPSSDNYRNPTLVNVSDLGEFKHRVRYEWEIFAGHDVTKIQVRFSQFDLGPNSNRLCLVASASFEQECYQGSRTEFWSDEFNTSLLRIVYEVNSPGNSPSNGFRIDKVRSWVAGIDRWVTRHPTTQLIKPSAVDPTVPMEADEQPINSERSSVSVIPDVYRRQCDRPNWIERLFSFLISENDCDQGNRSVETTKHPNVVQLQDLTRLDFPDSHLETTNFESHGVARPGQSNYYLADIKSVVSDYDVFTRGRGLGAAQYFEPEFTRYSESSEYTISGDFSGDGLDDIVVVTDQGTILVLVNGDGTFGSPIVANFSLPLTTKVDLANGNWGLHRFDGNADGLGDLIFVGQKSGSDRSLYMISILNTGTAGEPVFGTPFESRVGRMPRGFVTSQIETQFVVDDLNGDSFADVMVFVDVTDPAGGRDYALTFLGRSAFRFSEPVATYFETDELSFIGTRVGAIRAASIDGTGPSQQILLVSWQEADGEVHARTILNNGSFGPRRQVGGFTSDGIFAGQDVFVADINGDSRSDLIVAGNTWLGPARRADYFFLHRQAGSTDFEAPLTSFSPFLTTAKLGRFYSSIQGGAVGLVNERRPGGMAKAMSSRKLRVVGRPEFGPETTFTFPGTELESVDLDNSGSDDLVVFSRSSTGDVRALRVNSRGLIQPDPTFSTRHFLGEPSGESAFVGDVNGDGYGDLILVAASRPRFHDRFTERGTPESLAGVFVARGSRNGFAVPERWNTTVGVLIGPQLNFNAVLGDFNGDGLKDIAAIDIRQNQTEIQTAFSTAGQFGPNINGSLNGIDRQQILDPITSSGGTYEFLAKDFDGDGVDDIISVETFTGPGGRQGTRVSVFRSSRDQGFSISEDKRLEFSLAQRLDSKNEVYLGRFLKTPNAAVLARHSRAEFDESGGNLTRAWKYSREGWTQGRPSLSADSRLGGAATAAMSRLVTAAGNVADIDGDKRDELYLWNYASDKVLEITSVDVYDSDIDVAVKPVLSDFESDIRSRFGWQWTATAANSNEIVYGFSPPTETGKLIIRVDNVGTDSTAYKVIGNQRRDSKSVQVHFKSDDPPSAEWTAEVWEKIKGFAWRVYDSSDGFSSIQSIRPTVGGLPGANWRCHHPDIIVYSSDGRAKARFGCWMKVYDNSGAATWNHEYGHFRFRIRDEYCERDPGRFKIVAQCNPGHDGTFPLCAKSLMADSYRVKEYCTVLDHVHAPLTRKPTQHNPSWENLVNRYVNAARNLRLTDYPCSLLYGRDEILLSGGTKVTRIPNSNNCRISNPMPIRSPNPETYGAEMLPEPCIRVEDGSEICLGEINERIGRSSEPGIARATGRERQEVPTRQPEFSERPFAFARPAKPFHKADKDDSGFLTRNEFGQDTSIFDLVDTNDDGVVSPAEFGDMLLTYLFGRNISNSETVLFSRWDRDSNGRIEFAEFPYSTKYFGLLSSNGNSVTHDELKRGLPAFSYELNKSRQLESGWFTQLDKNESGALTREELAWSNELLEVLNEFDIDDNQELTLNEVNERSSIRWTLTEQVDELVDHFASFDFDGDGVLTEEEVRDYVHLIHMLDTDNDAALSRTELEEASRASGRQLSKLMEYANGIEFERLDANSDGSLSRAEAPDYESIWADLDKNGNDNVSRDEFADLEAVLQSTYKSFDFISGLPGEAG